MKEVISLLMETIVSGFISLAAAYTTYYINQATVKIKDEINSKATKSKAELLTLAADRVSNLAEIVVTAIEQTSAETLRKAVKDGTADRQLLLDLGTDATLQIKEQMSDVYKNAIISECGDIDTYINNVVEAKVYELKQKQGV